MTTTLFILASVLPAIGPAPTSGEIAQATLPDLLAGSWSGTWTRGGEAKPAIRLDKGRFTVLASTIPPWTTRLVLRDEGHGRCRGTLGVLSVVGLWKYERGQLVLCLREAEHGYPLRISDEDKQDVLTLRPR